MPDTIVNSPTFLVASGLGAAGTVLLATRLGLPISTTHALTGALVGAGVIHAGGAVALWHLGSAFFLPLLFSPLMAMGLVVPMYLTFRSGRITLGIDKESCLCLGREVVERVPLPAIGEQILKPPPVWRTRIDSGQSCRQRYLGSFLGVPVAGLLDFFHYLSAGAVGFARGLNDTPKIAALLIAGGSFGPFSSFGLVAVGIAVGGWISARRVAATMESPHCQHESGPRLFGKSHNRSPGHCRQFAGNAGFYHACQCGIVVWNRAPFWNRQPKGDFCDFAFLGRDTSSGYGSGGDSLLLADDHRVASSH